MLNMWKVTHCPSHFIYHSFLLSDYIPLFCFSLSPVSLWVARDPRWLLFATCVVKLHPEWTSACDGRAAASALCSWHPCFPGAIHSRCPPRSDAVAEGRGGQQTMWVVVHPCPLSGLYPGLACRAVFLSACLPHTSWPSFPTLPTWAVKSATFFMRRWKKTEKEENEGAWIPSSMCLQLPHLLQGRDHSDDPRHPVGNLCHPPVIVCACLAWGWGMRSLRPRLRILTKGERRSSYFNARKARDPLRNRR